MEVLQSEEELVAKDAAEHRNGQQEARMRMDPALVVGGKSAGGDDTMDMRMEQDVGTPAVQGWRGSRSRRPGILDRLPPLIRSGNWRRTAGGKSGPGS